MIYATHVKQNALVHRYPGSPHVLPLVSFPFSIIITSLSSSSSSSSSIILMCRLLDLRGLDKLLSLPDDRTADDTDMTLLFPLWMTGLDSGVTDDIDMTLLAVLMMVGVESK